MSAVELFHQDGKPAGVYHCSECRVVYLNREMAQSCHGQVVCKTEGCGKEVARHRLHIGLCDECDSKAWREKCAKDEFERYQKATPIPESEYEGPVFAESLGPEWFETMEAFREYYDDEDTRNLEYVWAAKDVGVPRVELCHITEQMLDGMLEDADESDLEGIEEFEEAIAAFNKANEGVTVWNVDYSRAIILNRSVVVAEDQV